MRTNYTVAILDRGLWAAWLFYGMCHILYIAKGPHSHILIRRWASRSLNGAAWLGHHPQRAHTWRVYYPVPFPCHLFSFYWLFCFSDLSYRRPFSFSTYLDPPFNRERYELSSPKSHVSSLRPCHNVAAFVEICLKVESNRPLGRSRTALGLGEALVVHPLSCARYMTQMLYRGKPYRENLQILQLRSSKCLAY